MARPFKFPARPEGGWPLTDAQCARFERLSYGVLRHVGLRPGYDEGEIVSRALMRALRSPACDESRMPFTRYVRIHTLRAISDYAGPVASRAEKWTRIDFESIDRYAALTILGEMVPARAASCP